MTAEQGKFLQLYHEKVCQFLGINPEKGVNNFSLVPPRNIPTTFWGFSALFPTVGSSRGSYVLYSSDQTRDIELFRRRISTLTIPDRVRELPIASNPVIQRMGEIKCALEGLPSIVLAYGERDDPTEEVIMLYCIVGVIPDRALKQIQQRHQEAVARLN